MKLHLDTSVRTLKSSFLLGGLLVSILALGGCRKHIDPTDPSIRNSPEGSPCSQDGLVDDGEDQNNQTLPIAGRGGYWYTFVDKEGSMVTPKAGEQGGVFKMSPGGAEGSKFAARMHGSIGTAEIVYSGMGLNFTEPKGPYDASRYKGVAFWGKKGPGSTSKVRLKVPDVNTDPDGGVCGECFNDFGIDFKLTNEWQFYVIPFSEMSQMKGWGSPKKSEITSGKIYGVQFQVNDPGQKYDIWIDNVQFTGCGG